MITFDKCRCFKGELEVPADKSITHRAVMFASMADAGSLIDNPLRSSDTEATINAMRSLGVDIIDEKDKLLIKSDGYRAFKEPSNIIDCGNSGTTARLLTGMLAPIGKYVVLTGDASLCRRPMDRVIHPLSLMRANIKARGNDSLLPLTIIHSEMVPRDIVAEVKSAQVKSAVLLSALQIDGISSYTEKVVTRNHTETMLQVFGADVDIDGMTTAIKGGQDLCGATFSVPGDFSSAAFFIAAAIAFEGSDITIKNCGLNPTRTGLLTALEQLGAKVSYEITNDSSEPIGNIYIKDSGLRGGKVSGDIVANLIDEVPVLAFLGLFSDEGIEIRDAAELRVKESDRITALAVNLAELGADVEQFPDGIKVYPLKSSPSKARLRSFDDHRICMINILLAKKFGTDILIEDVSAIDVSFPSFINDISLVSVK